MQTFEPGVLTWDRLFAVEDKNKEYAELNKIKVPLADLRVQIIELMKQGFTEVPLADLLFIIKHMREQNENS